MSKTRLQMVELLEPAVEALGYELVDLELNFSGRRGILRLFIDHLGATEQPVRTEPVAEPNDGSRSDGIRVEDCEAVSRHVSAVLDVEDPIQRDYHLEVSSPGMDRKLVKPAHFDRFAGQAVQGRFRQMLDGRRRFTGTLVARNGKIVYYKAFGKADNQSGRNLKRDDIFRIASQSKAITSTAVMMLWEEGKFRLDDPISKYIPEFKNPQVLKTFQYSDTSYTTTPASGEITIRQLVSHTSGLGYGVIDGDERF